MNRAHPVFMSRVMDVLVTHSIRFASKFRLSHKAAAIRAGQIDESVGIATQQFEH